MHEIRCRRSRNTRLRTLPGAGPPEIGACQLNVAGRKKMSVNTHALSVRRRFLVYAVLFLATIGLAGWARAQEPKTGDKIYVVTHVDVVPTEAAAGGKLLQQYVTESRKEKGA